MSDPTDPAPPPAPPVPLATRLRDLDDDRPRRRARRPVRREGVLPRSKVRLACFVVLTLALVASGTLCLLAIWGAAPTDVTWKAVTSLAVIAGVMAGFTVLNEMFGPPVESDDGHAL